MAIALPIPRVLLEQMKDPRAKPAPVSSHYFNQMHQVQQEGMEFLFTHPKLNLVVMNLVLKSRRHHSTPNNKEGKKIAAVGRKFYSLGALGIKVMSYIACMSSYALLDQFSEVMDSVPAIRRQNASFSRRRVCMFLGKQLLISAKHVLDLFTKTGTSASPCITMHGSGPGICKRTQGHSLRITPSRTMVGSSVMPPTLSCSTLIRLSRPSRLL